MKVSVIVPTYNCEKYIEECLNSLLNQTFDDYEIIVVDNKSTDNTLKLIKIFQEKKQNITLIELDKNYKQGIARNIGIEKAQGEYILFVDGDDKVSSDFIEKMYFQITENGADISICNWYCFDDKTGKFSENSDKKFWNEIYLKFQNRIFCWQDIKEYIYYLSRMVWNKIYRKNFLIENQIKFPGEIFFEDTVFAYDSLMKANKISIFNDIIIFYRINNNKSVTSNKNNILLDYFTVYSKIKENLKSQNVYTEMKYWYLEFVIHTLYFYWIQIDWKYKKEYFDKMKTMFNVFVTEDIPSKSQQEDLYHTTLLILRRIINYNFYICTFLYLKDKLLNIKY